MFGDLLQDVVFDPIILAFGQGKIIFVFFFIFRIAAFLVNFSPHGIVIIDFVFWKQQDVPLRNRRDLAEQCSAGFDAHMPVRHTQLADLYSFVGMEGIWL